MNKPNYQKDKGMTIVELLIACSITVLLMGAVALLMARTFYVNKYTIEQGLNNNELQKAIREFSLTLREARQSDEGAYLIESGDDFDLVFFANIDDDDPIERVHYYLEDRQLKRGIAEASGFPKQYPANDSSVTAVAKGIINTPDEPIFQYFNKDYPADMVSNPLSTPVTIENVSLIKLDMRANIDPNHVPDNMRMETFVWPRNIN